MPWHHLERNLNIEFHFDTEITFASK